VTDGVGVEHTRGLVWTELNGSSRTDSHATRS
jgi:hypothetical protein